VWFWFFSLEKEPKPKARKLKHALLWRGKLHDQKFHYRALACSARFQPAIRFIESL
jgi:hypothetical protein